MNKLISYLKANQYIRTAEITNELIQSPYFQRLKDIRKQGNSQNQIENFLLDEELIFEVIKIFMGERCPYSNLSNIDEELKAIILTDQHLNLYTRALFNNN